MWVGAVKRLAKDGHPWQPQSKTKICSEHFVGGQWSRTRGHPAYVPSIKLGYREEEKTEKDVERFKRHRKRQLQKEHQQSPVAARSRPTVRPRPPADSVARDEDESHDLGGVETDVKEIGVQTDIAYTSLCEESVVERFPSISPDSILKQCRRIKDMKRDGTDLEEIFQNPKLTKMAQLA